MTTTRQWNVEIYIDEHVDERMTNAEARLHTGDNRYLVGRGTAHRHPEDAEVAAIGDELAAARALSSLAHELIHTAATDIEQLTEEHVHLRS
ncbi:hypothetical protein GCM10009789_36750 [Kribbella sancticallisti]|uniref:DUF1876 domain-containing protein n=1 Tax=Kribbella sancticallisti TaxID=460087 RepID=A0ABN2DLC2_9ACTN